MPKVVKISVKCPKCATVMPLPITEDDLGKKKQAVCPKCYRATNYNIPLSLAPRFEPDPTQIGNKRDEATLLLEVVKNEDTDYQSFPLTSEYYTIGRKNEGSPESRPDIAVVTTDMRMSRKHAVIKKKGNVGFTLKDMGSKNGVEYNGSKLDPDEEVYLANGDRFKLGHTEFRVTLTEKTDSTIA